MKKLEPRPATSASQEYTVLSPDSTQLVVVEAEGRISIPAALYERIGAGPGGHVRLRKEGASLIIERVDA